MYLHLSPRPCGGQDRPLRHGRASGVVRRIAQVTLDGEGGVAGAVDGVGQGDVGGVAEVRGDEAREGRVVGGADGGVHRRRCDGPGGGEAGGGVMEGDGEVGWGVLGPVEIEACDELSGAGEGDGDGLTDVREVGLPFRIGGAVDRGQGELAGLVLIGGGDGETLGDVAWDGGDVGDVTILQSEGAHRGELVGRGVVVTDLDRDGGFGVFFIGVHVGGTQAGDGGVGLVCYGGEWPSLPVKGAIFEVGNLRRKRGVDVEGEIRSKSEA